MAVKRQGFCWINDLSSITADNGTAIKQVDRKETGDKAIGKRKKRGREKSYIKYTKQRLYNEYTRRTRNNPSGNENVSLKIAWFQNAPQSFDLFPKKQRDENR